MFYAILGIIMVVALFLIFRGDHDDSYNKSEKGQRKAQQTRSFSHTQGQSQPKKEQTHYQKEAGPKDAAILGGVFAGHSHALYLHPGVDGKYCRRAQDKGHRIGH